MAQQCFDGAGEITLLNSTSSFSVISTETGETFGSLMGAVGDSLTIPTGNFCAEYPDDWGSGSCDSCPDVPVLAFTPAAGSATPPPDPQVIPTVDGCEGEEAVHVYSGCLNDLLSEILAAIQGKPDYTAILEAIKTSVEGIDADTDELSSINTAVEGVEVLAATGNATSSSILAATNNILTEAQAINANTDTLEVLLSTITSVLQSEQDQTQIILAGILDAVTSKPEQKHKIISEQNTTVPAGLKSVTISNLEGVTVVGDAFEIGDGRRPASISYDATEVDRALAVLQGIKVSGGKWQWTGILPVAEI